jgi:predicted ATP-dependent serine protease
MERAQSVREIISKNFTTVVWGKQWQQAFGTPEVYGVWFVWGNSGSGKTTFLLQMLKELAKKYKVVYNSLEEGGGLTMQTQLVRNNMQEIKRNIQISCENMESLSKRLSGKRSPQIAIIDSFQYTGLNFAKYVKFKETHPTKL